MEWSTGKLYAALSPAGQRKLGRGLSEKWNALDKKKRDNVVKAMGAALKGARPSGFGKMKVEKRAEWIMRGFQSSSSRLQDLLVLIYFEDVRSELRDDFSQALPDEPFEKEDDAKEHAQKSVDALTPQRWPLEDVWFCAHTFAQFQKDEKIESIYRFVLHELDHRMQQLLDATNNTERTSDDGADLDEESPEFTTLDRLMIRSVVSSRCQTEGALSFDELDELVTELQRLNENRTRSWLYRGYLDRMLKREFAKWSEGDNQERRAWYVTGYLLAQMRGGTPSERSDLILNLDEPDREALFARKCVASAVLLPVVLKPLLETGQELLAKSWLASHGRHQFDQVAHIVYTWARRELLKTTQPNAVRLLLEVVERLADAQPALGPIGIEIKRLIAVAWRMEGRFQQADRYCTALLKEAFMAPRKAELLVQRALIQMKIARLENFGLFEKGDKRTGFLRGLEKARALFEQASEGDSPSPVALMALALPEVAEGTEENGEQAIHFLNEASDLMLQGDAVWKETGLMERVDFYKTLLRLRKLDDEEQTAVAHLVEVLQSDANLPADLVLEAVEAASVLNIPESVVVARLALRRHGLQVVPKLPLDPACDAENFRRELATVLEASEEKVNADIRWAAWSAVLAGAKRANPQDEVMVSQALDALEKLAHDSKKAGDRFLQFVKDEEGDGNSIWEKRDCAEARYRFYKKRKETELAVAMLEIMAHDAIGERHFVEASELLQLMKQDGANEEQRQRVQRRLDEASKTGDALADAAPSQAAQEPVSILFVGGNETQRQYKESLEAELAAEQVTAQFDFKGWSSNWGRALATTGNAIARHDAVVVMKFVRTGLGRAVRALAGEHNKPWIACPGRGRDSMKRAILEAARVVRKQAKP